MRWQQLQEIVKDQPLFETSLLLAGDSTRQQVKVTPIVKTTNRQN
jgi:hypothetical protein